MIDHEASSSLHRREVHLLPGLCQEKGPPQVSPVFLPGIMGFNEFQDGCSPLLQWHPLFRAV